MAVANTLAYYHYETFDTRNKLLFLTGGHLPPSLILAGKDGAYLSGATYAAPR
jgi:hypothetical protein